MRCGDLVALHKFLGKALARLKLRCLLRGTKDPQATPRELIHHTQRKRQLRANHSNTRLHLVRGGKQSAQVLRIARQAGGFFTDAAISWETVNLLDARRLPQLPYQRVLPAASTNDQYFHKRQRKLPV